MGNVRTDRLGPLAEGSVRIATEFSGISRGTEGLVFRGEVPGSLHHLMRCPFQEGALPGPVKYGYANVGKVVAGPQSWLGARVFSLFPHQSLFDLPGESVHLVPDSVPAKRAVLAANLETAINALWDAPPLVGHRVTLVGLGIVGGLIASLLRAIPGVDLEVIDPNPLRADLSEALGISLVSADDARGSRDLVYHASATADGLRTALSLAGTEARVVELSWYGTKSVEVPLGEAFHARRLQLVSSQVGQIAPANRARWSYADRLRLSLSLLSDPVYDHFLTEEVSLEELPDQMERITGPDFQGLMPIVSYR
ncbi:MAG: zinc-binding alcohol dehydrogenase [Pseudomonadota bacterium]